MATRPPFAFTDVCSLACLACITVYFLLAFKRKDLKEVSSPCGMFILMKLSFERGVLFLRMSPSKLFINLTKALLQSCAIAFIPAAYNFRLLLQQ